MKSYERNKMEVMQVAKIRNLRKFATCENSQVPAKFHKYLRSFASCENSQPTKFRTAKFFGHLLQKKKFWPNCKINTEKFKKNYRKLKNKLEKKIN